MAAEIREMLMPGPCPHCKAEDPRHYNIVDKRTRGQEVIGFHCQQCHGIWPTKTPSDLDTASVPSLPGPFKENEIQEALIRKGRVEELRVHVIDLDPDIDDKVLRNQLTLFLHWDENEQDHFLFECRKKGAFAYKLDPKLPIAWAKPPMTISNISPDHIGHYFNWSWIEAPITCGLEKLYPGVILRGTSPTEGADNS